MPGPAPSPPSAQCGAGAGRAARGRRRRAPLPPVSPMPSQGPVNSSPATACADPRPRTIAPEAFKWFVFIRHPRTENCNPSLPIRPRPRPLSEPEAPRRDDERPPRPSHGCAVLSRDGSTDSTAGLLTTKVQPYMSRACDLFLAMCLRFYVFFIPVVNRGCDRFVYSDHFFCKKNSHFLRIHKTGLFNR